MFMNQRLNICLTNSIWPGILTERNQRNAAAIARRKKYRNAMLSSQLLPPGSILALIRVCA